MLTQYKPKDDTIAFLKNNIKDEATLNQCIRGYMHLHNLDDNFISYDNNFYYYANKSKIDLNNENNELQNISNSISTHIQNIGISSGLIYNYKQLINIFPNLEGMIYEFKNKSIYVDHNDELVCLDVFLSENLYSKSIDFFLEKCSILEDKLEESELLILLHINNDIFGEKILNVLENYNEKCSMCFSFSSLETYQKFKDKIEMNFYNYIIFKTDVYGNSLIPNLISYHNIKKKLNFSYDYIIKVQCIDNISLFYLSTKYLFDKSLTELKYKLLMNSNTNCIFNPTLSQKLSKDHINITNLIKWSKFLKKDSECSIIGTFFSKSNLFDKILEFTHTYDSFSWFTNNMSDPLIVNKTNSPINFLDRAFGYLDINIEFKTENVDIFNQSNKVDSVKDSILNSELILSDDDSDLSINDPESSAEEIINEDSDINKESSNNSYVYDLDIHTDDLLKDELYLKKTIHENHINILMRNTYRPELFKLSIDSILKQKYSNYTVHISYDDKRCLEYLNDYNDKFYNNKIKIVHNSIKSDKKYNFNLYNNALLDRVKDGWVMFLDDDDKLVNDTVLKTINEWLCTMDIHTILFWKFKRPDKDIYPKNLNQVRLGDVANSGYIFNSKFKDYGRWKNIRFGDFYFIKDLLVNMNDKHRKSFKKFFIDEVLTTTILKDSIGNFGKKEFNNLFNKMGIYKIAISKSLKHLKRIRDIYNLYKLSKNSDNEPCLFFGVYSERDLFRIKSYVGLKYVMFGGSDIDDSLSLNYVSNILREISLLDKTHILSISKDITARLAKFNIKSRYIELDLVDRSIFKPSNVQNTAKKSIYIYNGFKKDSHSYKVYGGEIYEEVMRRLPQYKWILSSNLKANYSDMVDIYKQCFIALRLTKHDGNANTVQELKALGIPIIHNQSEYGIKWSSVDNIVETIKKIAS